MKRPGWWPLDPAVALDLRLADCRPRWLFNPLRVVLLPWIRREVARWDDVG